MINVIDDNSIKRIAGNLEGFHRSNNQYNFRCPYCGDSAKSKLKMRGWLFDYKGEVFFKCFNCDKSTSYSKFLQEWFPDEYLRYLGDKAFLKDDHKRKDESAISTYSTITREEFIKLPMVKDTLSGNKAAEYLDKRKVINRDSFFYTDNYGALLKELDLTSYSPEFRCNEERLLIPHFNRAGNLAFIQTRVLNNSTIRYRTYKVIEEEYKLWNIDQINLNKKVYVVEGALDGSFLQNCVAMSGSDAQLEKSILGSIKENLRIILDNEPRSPIILQKYENLIKKGYKVFHWPKIPYKDINDCILAGYDITKDIYNEDNYYQGMMGLFNFYNWKKM